MDILLYITVFLIIGIINCTKNGNLNFMELTVEEMKPAVGDETLGDVENLSEIEVGNNLNGYYDSKAFMRIIEELGLG